MRILSWWRDTARLYLRYMAAIAASVPVAVLYSYLAMKKLDSWWFTIPLLAAGLGSATIGWRFSQHLFVVQEEPMVAQAYTDTGYGLGLRVAAAAMAVTVSVLCSEPMKRLSPIQDNLLGGNAQVLQTSTSVNVGA